MWRTTPWDWDQIEYLHICLNYEDESLFRTRFMRRVNLIREWNANEGPIIPRFRPIQNNKTVEE